MNRIGYFLLLGYWLFSALGHSSLAQQEKQLVVLAIDSKYEPYSFRNNLGHADGFDVDLFVEICKIQGLDYRIKPMPFAHARQLVEGDSGLYVVPMLKTAERAQKLAFSNPHTEISQSLFVKKHSDIRNLDDLKGKTVLVQQGDVMHDYLLSSELECDIVAVENQLIALELLNHEDYDAALAARLQGRYFINKNNLNNIETAGKPFLPAQYCFAVSSADEELLYLINEGLDELKADGTYEEIYRSWFGLFEQNFLRRAYQKDITIVVTLVVLLVMFFIFWNFVLRRTVKRKTKQLRHELQKNKETQEKLRESEEKYRLLTETAAEIILIHDQQGFITFANKSARELLGVSQNELGSLSVNDLVPVRYQDELKKRRQKRLQDDTSVLTYTVEVKDIHGKILPLEVSSVPFIRDKQFDYLIVGRDVSSRIKYERELIRAKEKAEENDKLKSAFLANMSHEIRTPLNSILGFSELLQNAGYPIEKREKYLKTINQNGKHLMQIINDLMEVSLIEAGQAFLKPRQIDVRELVGQIAADAKERLINKEVKINVEDKIPIEKRIVNTDDTKIKQVLDNLINNSIKFTKQGDINISSEYSDNNHLYFTVSDTGIGIRKQDQEYVFERFRQGTAPEDELHSGTGLGLSIAQSLVELMGGTIWLESEEGKGTTVSFTVKVNNDTMNVEQDKHEPMSTVSNSGHARSKNILIVEDEDSNYLFLEAVLKKENHRVSRAADGKTALEIFESTHDEIDLVLMDIKIPKLDGLEVTRRMKEISSRVPIIAQTAYAMAGDKEKALDAGCDDYVAKPLSRGEVIRKVNQF